MTAPVRRIVLPIVLAMAFLTGLLPGSSPAPAQAAFSSVERELIGWLNADRAAVGLRPLQIWGKLAAIAETRARRMASANVMSHTISGSLARQLSDAGARYWGYGENIAMTSYPRGIEAARRIYRLWKGSPVHWAQILSRRYNYVGLGLEYRSSNGRTFGSLVFTESPDHTAPGAAITSVSRSGDDVTWTWRGWDVALQTHTSGIRDFDVQLRADGGTWRTVRDDWTGTTMTRPDMPGGHAYGVRVRARDRAGNVGAWTAESRISVP
jgi:uncharacterized protein YkwD